MVKRSAGRQLLFKRSVRVQGRGVSAHQNIAKRAPAQLVEGHRRQRREEEGSCATEVRRQSSMASHAHTKGRGPTARSSWEVQGSLVARQYSATGRRDRMRHPMRRHAQSGGALPPPAHLNAFEW